MILAAGMGTRLRPLTNSIPKALVPIQNTPALEWIIRRLSQIGVIDIIVNTHYLHEQIEFFAEQRKDRPPALTLSPEPTILGTGGGLLQCQHFWDKTPFFLHNVDIFSTANLRLAYQLHVDNHNLVTLLTQDRQTNTKLLIDQAQNICGIHYYRTEEYRLLRIPQGDIHEQGFSGIHVISPHIYPLIHESGSFSIIDCYLRLVQENHPIQAFDIGNAYWKDIGTPTQLAELEKDWITHPELSRCHLAT